MDAELKIRALTHTSKLMIERLTVEIEKEQTNQDKIIYVTCLKTARDTYVHFLKLLCE